MSKINELYKNGYIKEVEASNYMQDLLEIITTITHWLLLSYEKTKILASDSSIYINYYCSCLNIEYPIEKYKDAREKNLSLISEVRLNLYNVNNPVKYDNYRKKINDIMEKYYEIDIKYHKDEISLNESVSKMNDCYNKLNDINERIKKLLAKSNKSLELKKAED